MTIYKSTYDALCQSRINLKHIHKPGSGIHEHHIIPKHMGGQDVSENLTYLTVREHIIAHFLLWKIHGTVNDLRAMHMLGAKLTYKYRQTLGRWCYDNKIGVHSDSYEFKQRDLDKGRETQKREYEEFGIKNWYYWSSLEGRTERSRLGGLVGGQTTKSRRVGFFSEDPIIKQKIREGSIAGGKSAKGGKQFHHPISKEQKFVKIGSPEHAEILLVGFIPGTGLHLGPSKMYYDPKTLQQRKIFSCDIAPNDWILGVPPKKPNPSKMWYDPISLQCRKIYITDVAPDGWLSGMRPKSSKSNSN